MISCTAASLARRSSHVQRLTKIFVSHRLFHSSSSFAAPTTTFHLPDPSAPSEIHAGTNKWTPRLTKIVATIGPTSEQLPVLQEIVANGMRIMRLNFSHATVEEVELRTSNLLRCKGRHSLLEPSPLAPSENVRAVLLDTKGPEIRSGKLANDDSGHETIVLEQGKSITLDTSDARRDEGSTVEYLYIDYKNIHKALEPGMKVLLDDGAIVLTVSAIEDEQVVCSIDNTGELRSRAGVNLPGANTDLPAMSDKDKVDIKYGMTKDVDYVAASFVQNAEGVKEIKAYIQQCAKELGWTDDRPLPLLISKIESISALQNFDAILEASDGIMVARGDLGVELPLQQVTNAQKEMVAACNAVGKPVIVATQMLETMAKNPRPTRAEVADVTNAIYDGADCVMLSGETAKGKYPVDAVRTMNEIIAGAEGYVQSGGIGGVSVKRFEGENTMEASIAEAAVAASEHGAKAILVLTDSTRDVMKLPSLVSSYRPDVPILVFCPNAKIGRQLMIYRGIHPVLGATSEDVAIEEAMAMGFVESGDEVVVVGPSASMKLAKVE